MSEAVENATNGSGENEAASKDEENGTQQTLTDTKVNGTKDSLNDSGTAGEEAEDNANENDDNDEEADKNNDDENDDDKDDKATDDNAPRSRRTASKVAINNLVPAKKTPAKKPAATGKTPGRKSVSAASESPLKNRLPPYKPVEVELETKSILIGKSSDFACTLRGELTNIPPPKEGKFNVGDLIWAKMTGYPWWPCMVSIDPQTGKHSRYSSVAYKTDNVYHVQYFGDACRGWTTVGMAIPFEGYDKFAAFIDNELSKAGDAKNAVKKIHEKYTVKPSLVNKWIESVSEAEAAHKLELISRVKLLTFNYCETLPKTPKAPKPAKAPKTPKQPSTSVSTKTPKAPAAAKTPKTPKTAKVVEEDEAEESPEAGETTPKKTPKKRASRKPKLALKDSGDGDETKGSVYEFDDEFETEEQTPTFPTWTSRLPNDELRKAAIYEHADNLLLGKRSTFEEDPFDSDDSDEVYVDSNPPTPVKDEAEADDKAKTTGDDKPDSANKDDKTTETPGKRRGRKSAKMLEHEKTMSAKKGAKRQKEVEKIPAKEEGQSAKRPKLDKSKKKEPVEVAEEEDDKEEVPKVVIEMNGTSLIPTGGRSRKWGLTEDSEESGDSASELSASQASGKPKKEFNLICLKCGDEATPEWKLTQCAGQCAGRFHSDCMKFVTNAAGETVCEHCDTGVHPCFACNDKENLDTKKCTNKKCSRFYHLHCIAANYPSKVNETSNSFECPLHSCITCFQNELHTGGAKGSARQIVSCIMCPVAYHKNQVCIGAGSVELSRNFIICPDHYRNTKYKSHEEKQNVTYCFSCCKNGDLTCCELCPASFHKDCLEYEVNPDEPFVCMSCKIKFPLHYGDIVWTKSGSYRWWPAKIVNPDEIPQVLLNTHKYGEFPVYFFGSHNYAWSSKGRSYLFDEADSEPKKGDKKKALTATFKRAFEEAQAAIIEAKANKAIALQTLTIKPPKYISLQQNKYLMQRVADKTEQICNCVDKKQDCSDSNCLNRVTRDECPVSCPLGDKCKNRRMANRENAPVKPHRSPLHGWGLIAEGPIKKNQFVIEYVGEIIDQAECERRIQASNKSTYYFLTIDAQSIIDAGPKGNWARFMNHSCEPNCIAEKWMVNGLPRVGLFALRDINEGEELTFDYQYELQPGQENIKCSCGTKNCRGFVAKGQTPSAGNKRAAEQSAKKGGAKRARKQDPVTEAKKENSSDDKHENVCSVCGDDGRLLLCDKEDCFKSYHLKCVNLERSPRGTWICNTHDENQVE